MRIINHNTNIAKLFTRIQALEEKIETIISEAPKCADEVKNHIGGYAGAYTR